MSIRPLLLLSALLWIAACQPIAGDARFTAGNIYTEPRVIIDEPICDRLERDISTVDIEGGGDAFAGFAGCGWKFVQRKDFSCELLIRPRTRQSLPTTTDELLSYDFGCSSGIRVSCDRPGLDENWTCITSSDGSEPTSWICPSDANVLPLTGALAEDCERT